MTPEQDAQSDLGVMTAAPKDITLKGKAYTFSNLNMQDLARFEEWVKQQHIRTLKDALKDEEPEVRASVLAKARLTLSSEEIMQSTGSYSGLLYLLWLSAKKNHKDITPEQLGELFDPTELAEKDKLVDTLSGYGGSNDPPVKSGESS